MKILNAICLGMWIVQLCFGVVAAVIGESISAITFIFPVLICIVHYIEELAKE